MIFSKSRLLLLLTLLPGLAFRVSWAQEKCGTVAYQEIRLHRNPRLENTDQFEKWMKDKLQSRLKTLSGDRTQSSTYTIPVVVHVIHNGEPVGTGTNISDAQIISQINVINKDFPRNNLDAVNTPPEFLPVAGSMDIEFALAKQDPEGLATNGIVRVQGTKSSWAMVDNDTFKALSYWPAENYLNIWVINLQDGGLIGYTQLPVSNLPGLEDSSTDRLTDGVVIYYRAFGTNDGGGTFDLESRFSKGRTATHEIGHFFGLRHTWGDINSCSGTDYVDDTPTQIGSTSGCPTQAEVSCSHDKMFQNYLDYTDDGCMNIFTLGQVARMTTVLNNSPRRASLLVSPGLSDPVPANNDLGIKRIISPATASCAAVSPAIVVRNYGSNVITSTSIQLFVNGSGVETRDVLLNMSPMDTAIVTFSQVNLSFASVNSFVFQIVLTNATTDGKSSNDSKSESVVVPSQGSLPVFEPFNVTPSTWSVTNPDGQTTWQNGTAPNGNSSNKSMLMDFYHYENRGAIDQLITPVFDFSQIPLATIKFDLAYAPFNSQYADQLRVVVYTGCDFSTTVEIFNKSGTTLATTSSHSSAFVPKSSGEWKSETISLNQFLGQSNVRIAFIGTNDNGNNLYLDAVQIITTDITDAAIVKMKSPATVICINNPVPVVTVRNNGSNLITHFKIASMLNGGAAVIQSFSNLQLAPGQEADFTQNSVMLKPGDNTLTFDLQNPNDATDVNPSDNVLPINLTLNTSQDIIPIRQNFDTDYSAWTISSQGAQMKLVTTPTNNNASLVYNGFTNASFGDSTWLVSPVLDFSKTLKASLFFDVSYATRSTGIERLRILSSGNCGVTFQNVLFNQTGDLFSATNSDSSWAPHSGTDWNLEYDNTGWRREYINLDALAGTENVRLAFVVTNGHGNNMYLDNIEIFVDDNQNPAAIDAEHLVYYNSDKTDPKITFNLPEKEKVRLQIYNTLGQIVADEELPEILNQTYQFDLAGKPGVYIVRIQIGKQLSSMKIFIPN